MCHGWVNQLSEEQTIAVAPLLRALSGLMSATEELQESGPDESPAPVPQPVQSPQISLTSLEALEQTLAPALETEDPQILKQAISKCLELVRIEKARPAPSQTETVLRATPTSLDAETGLPGRLLFEKVVTDAIADRRNFVTALFVVERLPLINKRFGRAVGDRVLLFVAQYLAQELPDSNSLSRWSGAAFSTIINAENSDKMESQIRAISNKPLSANIDVGNRSVMLTISCACMMEQISANASAESLFAKMDSFVTARTGA